MNGISALIALLWGIIGGLLWIWFMIVLIRIGHDYLNSKKPTVIVIMDCNENYYVKNIGKEPAINIVVMHRRYEIEKPNEWRELIRLASLQKGECMAFDLPEAFRGEDVGMDYDDLMERNYCSTWIDGKIKIRKGFLFRKGQE